MRRGPSCIRSALFSRQLVLFGHVSSPGLFAGGIVELGIHPAGGHRHDNGLYSTDFSIADMVFLSIAKAVTHSWVAADGHGGCKINQAGGFGV